MITKDTNFLIVGLGLIGGSYARALSAKGYKVSAIDINTDSLTYAKENGFISAGSVAADPILIKNADLLIFGLYPNAMIQWIKDYQHLFSPGLLITDVSGVKSGIVDTVQDMLRKDVEFIGSHPMAGREMKGIRNSDPARFLPANFIITPTDENTQEAVDTVHQLGELLDFAHIVQLSCKEHDEMVGFLSQLTHAIAVSLMNCNDNPHLSEYTGDSFRDLTRIAKINEDLWSELFFLNKDVLIQQIDSFSEELNHLRQTLASGEEEALKDMFRQSTRRRKVFDKQ